MPANGSMMISMNEFTVAISPEYTASTRALKNPASSSQTALYG